MHLPAQQSVSPARSRGFSVRTSVDLRDLNRAGPNLRMGQERPGRIRPQSAQKPAYAIGSIPCTWSAFDCT